MGTKLLEDHEEGKEVLNRLRWGGSAQNRILRWHHKWQTSITPEITGDRNQRGTWWHQ